MEIPMALSSENTITVQKAGDALLPCSLSVRVKTGNPRTVRERVYQGERVLAIAGGVELPPCFRSPGLTVS